MYQKKNQYKVKFVFKKDYSLNKFYCELWVGRNILFTSKSYRKKNELQSYCGDMIEDLIMRGFSNHDVTNQQIGGKMTFTETEQERLYKEFKKEIELP